jgi:hypothetical protein
MAEEQSGKIKIAYFVSVEQELFEINCFFKSYLNNTDFTNILFYEEGSRIESSLIKRKYQFDSIVKLKSINYSKNIFKTVKNLIHNKREFKKNDRCVDYLISINNNTLTFCQLYSSLKKFKLIILKTIHPSFLFNDYISSIYYSFFSLLFFRRLTIYKKHIKNGKLFNYPFPIIIPNYILSTNLKSFNEETQKVMASFLVQHPYKNYFSDIKSNISPLLIINSLYMEIDKNYLREVNDALIKNNLNNLKVYIKDHPMSKISINDLKKLFSNKHVIINNIDSGIDILVSSQFSSVIAVGPSTLNYYAKLFGLNVIDLTNEISITNNEIMSLINEMNESINNLGEDHEKVLNEIIK